MKRRFKPADISDELPPSKRKCLAVDKNDIDFLREEIRDIKTFIGEMNIDIDLIGKYLREDLDSRLEDIVDRIRQFE